MSHRGRQRGERRLPLVVALLVAAAIPLVLPDQMLPGPPWVVPLVILVLLAAMLILDPGRIDRHSVELHRVRLAILVVLCLTQGVAMIGFVRAIIDGTSDVVDDGADLLRIGACTWVGLVITFGFLYWELDLGGPGRRAHEERQHPDLAFPQDMNPDVAKPGWRPTFPDYLYLAVTNGFAFSPTDVMPLAHWAKAAMAIQSALAMVVIGLVVARAVNIIS